MSCDILGAVNHLVQSSFILFKSRLASLMIIVFAFCLCAKAVFALSVDQMRVGVHPDKTRLVLDLSAKADFRAFVLDNPYRLVVDMPSFSWHAGNVDKSAASGITAMRQGNLQPGISRLVFDLNRPIAVRSAFVLPRAEGRPDRLVIDFSAISSAAFQTEKTKVHGTLNVKDSAANYAASTQGAEQRTASLNNNSIPTPSSKPAPTVKPLIVIDPGHGGVDPGAIGHNKLMEKQVVLALSRELKSQLEATGRYRVIMTRDSDKFIKLSDRVKFARQHGGDLFISIHADSIEKSNVRGASVYTLSEKASDAQTAKLAAKENRADLVAGIDLSVEDEDVANILVDLAMRDTTNQAKFFANSVVGTFKGIGLRVLDNTHRSAGFAVLKAPDIPSVLVEAGFMSNRSEAELLNTTEYRKKVAKALVNGVDVYFEQVRKNQRL